MKYRKCNFPKCNKKADHIESLGLSIPASDAYCEKHWKIREKRKQRSKE